MGYIGKTVILKIPSAFIVALFLGLNCTDSSKQEFVSDHLIKLEFENIEARSEYTTSINKPVVIELFANDLDYNKYESENAKQEYYDLVDFQGYYIEIISPILDSMEIERISLAQKDLQLNFSIIKGASFIVDLHKITAKQGLILFNGKTEPVFWNGNDNGELDSFLKEYYN